MDLSIILFAILISLIIGLIRRNINNKKDFRYLIEPHLKRYGLKYIQSEYPGIFQVGPFEKFELEIGKPQINNGAIRYEKTYYRKVTIQRKDNQEMEVWAKIETGWFKDESIQFEPELDEINNASPSIKTD